MNVPFVDLKIQYQSLKSEMDKAIHDVIDNTAFVGGKYLKDFEESFAKAYGVKHCIGVGNGTDAIYIALKTLGIGPGDEVITTAISWIATSEVITQCGARVVFVDIDPNDFTIDVSKIEEKITDKTKAIIPVHFYGQAANIKAIKDICNKHNLFLVEDCAQAHFATFNGQNAGTFGEIGTFSFFPGKNLGAYGDGGAVVTNDDALARKIELFSRHGALVKHEHEIEGINSRLDGIQAAILSVKLPHIMQWSKQRNENARYYNELLKDVEGITTPQIDENRFHVFHLYVIRTSKRDELQAFLNEKGIQTGIHYPTALPFLKAYDYLNHKPEDFPVAYKYQSEILSLPMYPELTKEMVEYTCAAIKEFLG